MAENHLFFCIFWRIYILSFKYLIYITNLYIVLYAFMLVSFI